MSLCQDIISAYNSFGEKLTNDFRALVLKNKKINKIIIIIKTFIGI